MAGQGTAFRRSKAIAGTVLAGLGMFILYEELAGAVVWARCVLGADGSEGLAGQLALSQAWQGYVAAHQPLLQAFIEHMLVSSWPLLLVMVGTLLARDTLRGEVKERPKKDCGVVDSAVGRSTSE